MWDNGQAEYSGAQSNTMTDALPSGCTPVGGAFAFGSTDRMDDRDAARFWAKVDRQGADRCWEWLASRSTRGYGRWYVRPRAQQAHRIAYELLVGPIPDGLVIDHLCRNRGCINPAHMEPVTNRENVLRGVSPVALAAKATHCPAGHPYSGIHVYVRQSGSRDCRTCANAARRARHLAPAPEATE